MPFHSQPSAAVRALVCALGLLGAPAFAAELLPSAGVGSGASYDAPTSVRAHLQLFAGADLLLDDAPVLFQLRAAVIFGSPAVGLEPTLGVGLYQHDKGLLASNVYLAAGPGFWFSTPVPHLSVRVGAMLARLIGLEVGVRALGVSPQGSLSIQLDVAAGLTLVAGLIGVTQRD